MTLTYGDYVADPSDKRAQMALFIHKHSSMSKLAVNVVFSIAAYYGLLFLLGVGVDEAVSAEPSTTSLVSMSVSVLVFYGLAGFASYRFSIFAERRITKIAARRFSRAVTEKRIVQVPGAVRTAWLRTSDQHKANGGAEADDPMVAAILYEASTDPQVLGVIQDMDMVGADWVLRRNATIWLDEKLTQLLRQRVGNGSEDPAAPITKE